MHCAEHAFCPAAFGSVHADAMAPPVFACQNGMLRIQNEPDQCSPKPPRRLVIVDHDSPHSPVEIPKITASATAGPRSGVDISNYGENASARVTELRRAASFLLSRRLANRRDRHESWRVVVGYAGGGMATCRGRVVLPAAAGPQPGSSEIRVAPDAARWSFPGGYSAQSTM